MSSQVQLVGNAEHIPICYPYARVSTPGQVEYGLSLEEQEARLGRYYTAFLEPQGIRWGGGENGKVFTDAGVSAFKKRFAERPAGGVICARLKRGDHIVITKLDRAFRRASDAVVMVDQWNAMGVVVHLLDFGIDTSKPLGRLLLRMLAALAEYERDVTAERTAIVMARRKQRTGVTNQYAGYGNRLVGPRNKKKVVADPHELAVMATIYRLREEGVEFRAIWLQLLTNKVKTSKGKEWSLSRIKRAHQAECLRRQSQASSGCSTTETGSTPS